MRLLFAACSVLFGLSLAAAVDPCVFCGSAIHNGERCPFAPDDARSAVEAFNQHGTEIPDALIQKYGNIPPRSDDVFGDTDQPDQPSAPAPARADRPPEPPTPPPAAAARAIPRDAPRPHQHADQDQAIGNRGRARASARGGARAARGGHAAGRGAGRRTVPVGRRTAGDAGNDAGGNNDAADSFNETAGLPVGSAQFPVTKWSLTLTKQKGADIPESWFDKVQSWCDNFAERGFIAIERGGARSHKHVQGVLELRCPTDAASIKKVNDHMKRWIPIGRFMKNSGGSLMLKPLEQHQELPEMLGYCASPLNPPPPHSLICSCLRRPKR